MAGKIPASWLNNMYKILATTIPNNGISTGISQVTTPVGAPVEAADLQDYLTKLEKLKKNTYLRYGSWTSNTYDKPDQGDPVIEQESIENLTNSLANICANNSVSVSFSNQAFSNFSGFNNTSDSVTSSFSNFDNCSRRARSGFSQSCGTDSFIGGFNRTSGSGNNNTATRTNCSQNSGNYTTFQAFSTGSGFSQKTANFGRGFSNNSNFGRFGTESNFTPGRTTRFSNFRSNNNFSQRFTTTFSQSFSNFTRRSFNFSFSNDTNRVFQGGNSKTCNTFIFNFSVKGDGTTITNSNFST